jgi:hypothetical protein
MEGSPASGSSRFRMGPARASAHQMGNSLAVYQSRRPNADEFFAGRVDD